MNWSDLKAYVSWMGKKLSNIHDINSKFYWTDRSPLFIQVNNTLTGMLTIRACQNIEIFHRNFEQNLDSYTKVCNSSIHVQRWFQSRLDLICSLFAAVAILFSILGKPYFNSTSGQIGVLLTYILNLTSIFQWLLVQNCEISSLVSFWSVYKLWP